LRRINQIRPIKKTNTIIPAIISKIVDENKIKLVVWPSSVGVAAGEGEDETVWVTT
jgi:hypothetical protein